MADIVKAWQCIGCGRLDAPAACVGICRDEPVELVSAADHEAALRRLAGAEARAEALADALRRIVATHPKAGNWEQAYAVMVEQAGRALAADRPA